MTSLLQSRKHGFQAFLALSAGLLAAGCGGVSTSSTTGTGGTGAGGTGGTGGTGGSWACDGTLGLPGRPALQMEGPALVTGDLDGDGKSDLAVIESKGGFDTTAQVVVLLSQGGGLLAPPVAYPVGKGALSLLVADLNGDGKPDLVAAGHDKGIDGDGFVNVLLNLGQGTFAQAVSYPTGKGTVAAAAADLSGDGKPDLAVVNGFIGGVSVLVNQGGGVFAAPVATSIPANPGSVTWESNAIATADIDADGKIDLVVAVDLKDNGGENAVLVLPNQGGGTFGPALEKAYDTGAGSYSRINALAVGDLDGDGKTDIAVARSSTLDARGHLTIVRNLGGSQFGPPDDHVAGQSGRAVGLGDLDGDGKPDLAIGDAGEVNILLNDGSGAFAAPATYPATASALALGDVDGDGKLDIAGVDGRTTGQGFQNGTGASVLLNQGAAIFPSLPIVGSGEVAGAADFDGDGKPELLLAGNDELRVLKNQGNGTFAAPTVLAGLGSAVRAVDVNGDGKLDLIAPASAGAADHGLRVLLGTGNGAFAAPVSYLMGQIVSVLEVVDLDGDGAPDLAALVPRPDSPDIQILIVLRNQGNGAFAAPAAPVELNEVLRALVDLNGDGRPDVVTRSHSDVGVQLNKGDGTFGERVSYPEGQLYGPGDAVLGDIDGDMRPDLVVPDYDGTKMSIHHNLGGGAFGASTVSELSLGPGQSGLTFGSVQLLDMNGDGKLDVLGAYGKSTSVILNMGGGVFAAPITTSVGAGFSSFAVGDLNGDGRPDLALPGILGVTVLLTQSDGSFATPLGFVVGSAGRALVKDMSGDGRDDVVLGVGGATQPGALVLLNTCLP